MVRGLSGMFAEGQACLKFWCYGCLLIRCGGERSGRSESRAWWMVESGLVYFMSWWCVKSSLVVIWTRGRAREDDSLRPKNSRLRSGKRQRGSGQSTIHGPSPHTARDETRVLSPRALRVNQPVHRLLGLPTTVLPSLSSINQQQQQQLIQFVDFSSFQLPVMHS
jgi:hypothetical protein